MVVDIRHRGIKVDRARLEQTLANYESRAKQLAADLRGELGAPGLNLSSSKQLLKVLWADGLEIEDTSKETLSASLHPVAGRILEYRKLAGLCTTMRGWRKNLDSDNRLYPPLNPLGAETGRFSCKDPNLLGVSREPKIRGCFHPRRLSTFLSRPISQISKCGSPPGLRARSGCLKCSAMVAIFMPRPRSGS